MTDVAQVRSEWNIFTFLFLFVYLFDFQRKTVKLNLSVSIICNPPRQSRCPVLTEISCSSRHSSLSSKEETLHQF